MTYFILKPYTADLYNHFKKESFLAKHPKPHKNANCVLISKVMHKDGSENVTTVYALLDNNGEEVFKIVGDNVMWDYSGISTIIWKNQKPHNFDQYTELSQEDTKKLQSIFRVQAKATTYAYLDIEADSEDEAMEIANSTDGGEFITEDNHGDWEIISAEKQQDA